MAKITQYSRISHHTTSGFTNSVFTIPTSNDFTDGSWTIYDLALSEFGVNETDKRVFIRCDTEVMELDLMSHFTASTSGSSVATMSQYNIGTGEVRLFKIEVKGVSDDTNHYTYVADLFGGLRNATGSNISFTGGTYSRNSYQDFSATGIGPQLSLTGLTASLIINGAPGFTVSWSAKVHIQ